MIMFRIRKSFLLWSELSYWLQFSLRSFEWWHSFTHCSQISHSWVCWAVRRRIHVRILIFSLWHSQCVYMLGRRSYFPDHSEHMRLPHLRKWVEVIVSTIWFSCTWDQVLENNVCEGWYYWKYANFVLPTVEAFIDIISNKFQECFFFSGRNLTVFVHF